MPGPAERVGAGGGFPIPQSVVLVLLYVGLIRLLALYWTLQMIPSARYPSAALEALVGGTDAGGWSVVQFIAGVNVLLVLYLWLDYRRRVSGATAWRLGLQVAYVGAGLLLLYLTYSLYRLSRVEITESWHRVL